MALAAILETLDGLDENLRVFYVEHDDGRFILDLDGDIAGHPVTSSLENAFRKESERRKEQGKALADARARLAELETADTGDALGSSDVLAAQIEAANAERDKFRAQTERLLLSHALDDALLAAAILPAHLPAVRALHKSDFKIKKDGDELAVVVGEDDADPVEFIREWAATDEGKIYVGAARNNGGGARGSGPRLGYTGPNPWKRETRNLTKQGEIARDDPDLAQRLAREAGVNLRL